MLVVNEYSSISKKLIKKWDILWTQSANKTFFNSYEWFNICLQTFNYSEILIITAEKNGKIIAILPLIKRKKNYMSPGEKYLDNTTFLITSDYNDVINSIVNYIKVKKYQLILNEVDESLVRYFHNVLTEFSSNNPMAILDNGIENAVKHKELRYLKRIREKNKENIDFQIYVGPDCYEQVDRIFQIENSSSKPRLKRNIFCEEKAKLLFKNISKNNNSLIIILKYDGVDIAHLFSVKWNNTIMAYHMAYNSEYYYLQPGKIIFIELMEYMIKKGYKKLDFSRGDSTLKRHFSNSNIKKYNIYINCNIFMAIIVKIRKKIFKLKNTKFYKKIKKIIKRKQKNN